MPARPNSTSRATRARWRSRSAACSCSSGSEPGTPARAQPILEVHVSQQPPSWGPFGEPELRIRAADEAVPMLGAVLSYGHIVAPLQAAWLAACAREPQRLQQPLRHAGDGAEELAGGGGRGRRRHRRTLRPGGGRRRRRVRRPGAQGAGHDYRQTAWVGQVTLDGGTPGTAFERFTRQGPAALLPLEARRPRRSAPRSSGAFPPTTIRWPG